MATRILPKFIYNGVEYQISIDENAVNADSEARENSARPITSGGVYELFLGLAEFMGRRVVTEISSGPANADGSIPTAQAVSARALEAAKEVLANVANTSTWHVKTPRQNVFTRVTKVSDIPVGSTGWLTQADGNYAANNFVYRKESNKYYTEEPLKNVLMYDATNGRFCQWTGSALAFIQ